MINVKTIVQSMRVPFLVLTPVCVFLGASTVVANQAEVSLFVLLLALLGAFLAHISVNTLNEYLDFKSGLDLETIKTPFSGGSRNHKNTLQWRQRRLAAEPGDGRHCIGCWHFILGCAVDDRQFFCLAIRHRYRADRHYRAANNSDIHQLD